MNESTANILVITPVRHIQDVHELLQSIGNVTLLENPTRAEVLDCIESYDAIFTNPNKSNVLIDKEIMDKGSRLKVICTASTGTNHIDKDYARAKSITILSLTEEREVINRVSSTAEHAFALMLSALRNIPQSFDSVRAGSWDYQPFIGRQVNHLTIGVVGYGRLGSKFCNYALAFGARVLVYDPHKRISEPYHKQVNLPIFLKKCDVISLHVHVSDETFHMVDKNWLDSVKKDVLIVNTSRGEICNEVDIIEFLKKCPAARYATDVIAEEITDKPSNKLIEYARESNQVLITPHIGGMTKEGQLIAYNHAAKLLQRFFSKKNQAYQSA